MLIQPLIENAILHGLIVGQNPEAHLEVQMKLHDGKICITVEDNGVGVNNKAKSTIKSSIKETSIGLSSIKERIEMLNIQDKQQNASFNIAAGANGKGTVATICLPVICSNANVAF